MIDLEAVSLNIYDITNENLQRAGSTMPVSRDVYGLYSRSFTYEADYLEIMTINKESFPSAVYLLLLNRPIDQASEEFFLSKEKKQSEAVFKKNVLRSVLLSEEYALKHSIIRNCFILLDEKRSSVKGIIKKAIIYLWQMIPGDFRGAIKSVFRRMKT